ncbi:hypothetical protein ACFY3N_18885 [Streptomyces sp. NPDC000348]|uniref:hypothetical protein n=1 Tax=Streptomyces sp. NPDC000348 TaxID=3364538 RepID=UPI00369E0675
MTTGTVTVRGSPGKALPTAVVAGDGTPRVPGKCPDASGGTWDDGAPVHLWTCHTGPDQRRTLP